MKLVLDIETNSKHDHIWCCVTKNIDTGEVICHTESKTLQPLIEQSDTIIGHNLISFDAPILNRLWKTTIKPSQTRDTLILSRLLSPSLEGGHSLAAWGIRIAEHKQEFEDWDGGLTEQMITYCKQDVEVTHKLYNHLLTELKQQKFDNRSIELEHKVQAIIAKQERNGFKLDERKATILLSELQGKLVNIEVNLQSIFPTKTTERVSEKTGKKLKDKVEDFNPGSRKQIGERLIEKGWKPEKYTEKGQPIVDEGTLEGVDIPEAKAINEYLMLQKRIAQIESWLKALGNDGRVHGKVITNGAVTGRMTHMSPNMAQVPNSGSPYGEECRDLWIVDKGYKLVGIDASGLELRMLAHYMKDDAYTSEVVSGDIHTANQKAAGLETRNQAKTFIYAFLYGAGDAKIGKVVGAGAKEGQALKSRFLKNTPSLEALRKKISRIVADKISILGIDGRRIQIRSDHAALNSLLQSAGAIVMKQALVILNDELRRAKINYKFVANVHDEWQIEVEESRAEEAGQLGTKAIELAGVKLNMRCSLAGEYKVGNSWKETH